MAVHFTLITKEMSVEYLGKFVDLSNSSDNTLVFDTVYPFPKKVGIIINHGNGSTMEQFLLAAKQSQKVKLFGTTTFGCSVRKLPIGLLSFGGRAHFRVYNRRQRITIRFLH